VATCCKPVLPAASRRGRARWIFCVFDKIALRRP